MVEEQTMLGNIGPDAARHGDTWESQRNFRWMKGFDRWKTGAARGIRTPDPVITDHKIQLYNQCVAVLPNAPKNTV